MKNFIKTSTVFAFGLAAACASQTSNEADKAGDTQKQADAPQPTAAAATPAAGPKPQYGSFGFDLAGMKKDVAPGHDFYTYANGQWLEATAIPADRSNYGMFTRLDEISQERTRGVIEEAAKQKGAEGSEAQKVGDMFASFMDEAAIEKAGLQPLEPTLKAIAAVKTKKELAKLIAEQHKEESSAPFGFYIGVDDKNPDRYIPSFVQSGTGLPDRDYYLKKDDARMADIRAKYVAHIEAMLKLAKIDKADAKAKAILALEHKIAEAHWTRVDSRDADKTYNLWTSADFAKKAPGFEWGVYFETVGLGAQKEFVVAQPSAITGTAKLLGKESLETWKDYLSFRALKDAASVLPKAFVDEDFAFDGRVLGGTPELQARWKRGVDVVNATLGEAVGKLYVEKYFPKESKEKADALVRNVIKAMDKRLEGLTWMSPETKAKAKAKLAAFTPKIGYPDKWRDYSALKVVAGDMFGNAQRAARFEFERQMKKLGQPIDRGEWFMTPMTVNAYANPTMNEIVFPAAILQPPFFDANADPAVNYGGIGAVIGHEISHHFDDQGRKYDATGKLADWWTKEDVTRFEALTKQLVDQYAAYEPFPGAKVNGELTLGENIADLAGLTVAFDAYKSSLGGAAPAVIDGFTGEQRFFLGWAQVWRRKYRDEELRKRLLTDPHSPSQYRASVVRNLDTWYEAFKPEDKKSLVLAPESRVRIW